MADWLKESKQDKGIKLVLFLISPFLSFLYSLKRIKTKSSFIVFFLFCVFFGMAFTVGNVRTEGSGDGIAYRIGFENYKYVTSSQFYDGLKEFLIFDEGGKDYYFDTIAFYVSRVTDNYHVMFMIFAIVFAFFSLKSFKFLTQDNNFDNSFASYILAFIFIMTNDIHNINGVRMWTAAWIGVYAILQIFRNGNKLYFLLLLTTPFFHGSFWIFVAVALLAFFLRRFEKIWIVLFIVSFFVGSIATEVLIDISDRLPTFMQRMVDAYTSQEAIELRNSEGNGFYWVTRLFRMLMMLYVNFMIYLFIKNSIVIKTNPKSKSLYLFLLVYMTFVNFTMPVPSLGGRYMILAYPLIAYIWLVNFKGKKYDKFLSIAPIVFSWNIFFLLIRSYPSVTEIGFYISSPFYLIYKYLFV